MVQFWNVKVSSRRPLSSASVDGGPDEPAYVEEEHRETPVSLKDKQVRMEQQVYRIWTYVIFSPSVRSTNPPPFLASFLHLKNQAPLVYRTC